MDYEGIEESPELAAFVAWMKGLSDDERAFAMWRLGDEFCRHCGCIQPESTWCQCWNDE